MAIWTKKLIFRCSEGDADWYDKLKEKVGLATMSDLLRLALRRMAEAESVQRPITKVASKKEEAAFPLTSWKRKKTAKKPVELKKKVAKGVAR